MKKTVLIFLFISQIVFVYAQPLMQLMSAITVTPNPVPSGSYVTISTSIKNNGASSTFDFECDIEPLGGGSATVVKKMCSVSISSGATQPVTFSPVSPGGYINLSPGNYQIRIIALFTSCFQCGNTGCSLSTVSPGSFVNPLPITVTSAYCGGTTNLTSCSSSFSDGSGSNTYCNNSNCSWLIQPAGAASITLSFSAFDVESGFDFVKVYNGTNATAPLLGSFSGSSIPSSVTSGSAMFVLFTSDNATVKQGWTASYSCTSGCTAITNFNLASQTVTVIAPSSASFSISPTGTSPTYQWQYSTNSGSSWSNVPNSSPYSGTTSSALTINPTSTSMNGYMYRCFLSNACSSGYSNWGTLNVNTACTTPTSQANNIFFNGVGSNSITVNWTNGNGSRRVVEINTSNSFSAPANATDPSANTNYTGGQQVVYNNSGSSVTITGLSASTTYWFRVYEANCSGSNSLYNVNSASNNPNSQATQAPAPTVNSLICTNVILNNPNIPQNFTFYSDNTPYSNNQPIQVCADGSTATYFKVNVSNTSLINFRVLDEFGAVATDANKYGQIGSANVFNNNVEVAYTHPTYMDASGVFRPCTLEVIYNGNPIGVSFPLNIYRAPIVFVHGFVGSKTTFEEMENTLLDNLLYPPLPNSPLIQRIGYKSSSLFHFYTNRKKVPNGIDDVLTKARNANYSAGKVIVISHSMGGVLSRLYLQSTYSNTLYRFDIQKLITANTPHYGTQFANWGVNTLNTAGDVMDIISIIQPEIATALSVVSTLADPLMGAIKDMQVNSFATTNNLNIPLASQNLVPSVTLSTDQIGDYSSQKAIAIRAVLGNKIPAIYYGETNDLIVPLSSQQSGILLKPTVLQQWHVGSCANTNIMGQIQNLINTEPNSGAFALGGFPPNTLNPPPLISVPNNSVAHLVQVTDSIKINSPTTGQIFNPNDNVAVNISYSGNISHMVLVVYGSSISPITIDTTNVNLLNFQIPSNAVGLLNLLLLGGDASNWYAQDTIHIIVSATNIADSITTNPTSVNLPLGLYEPISVDGYFNGTQIGVNLIGTTGLSVQYDPTYLSYDGQGTFRGISIGTTSVIYSYQGQSDTTIFTIYDDPSALTASFNYSTDNLCANNSVSFQDQSLGLAVSYNWTFIGGVPSSSTAQNPIINYLVAGIYPVSLRTTFVNGTDSLLIDSLINVQVVPTPSITGANAICLGDSTTLDAGSGYTNYLWTTSATTQSITTSLSGTYTVTVTNGNGCTGSASSTIIVNPLPTPTIIGNTAFCQNDSTILDAGSGYTNYLWSTNETSQTITVATTGTYSVNVTDINGCSSTSPSISTTINSLPTATISTSGVTTFCQGDSVSLTASSASSYLWSNSATTQSITVSTSANYAVTVTDANSCSATSLPTTVTVNSLPTVTITANGSTTFCQGDSVTLTASSASSYLWSTGAITQSITVSTFANYSVTVIDGNSCSATSLSTTVTVNPLPTATVTANGAITFCQGDSVTLTASAANSYLWSNGATTQSITVSTSANYSVTVTDGNSCSATSLPTTVTVNSLPTATITANGLTTFCQGDSVILTASTANSYLWSNGATTQSITVSTSANYSATVTDGNICSATSLPTTVTVNPSPVLSPLSLSSNYIIVSPVNSTDTIQWYYQDSLQTGNDDSLLCVGDGYYDCIVTNSFGCSATADSININSCTVGITELNSANNFSVFPNPTDELLNIKGDELANGNFEITLTNELGQELKKQSLKVSNNSFETKMNIKELASGIYFLKISSNKVQKTIKVQKQ